MTVTKYTWPAVREFRDRAVELADLEDWWASKTRDPVNLHGRRRVGKSWLFRRFAHGKPAVILVADRIVTGRQLTHMADQLADVLGVRPQLDDVADLFAVLYDLSRRRKVLVVIDEFPYLLGTTAAEHQRSLSAIQAVMERKRDDSKLKLILTGSTIAQMEELQAEKNPLHGRLKPLPLWPMRFAQATLILGARARADDVLGQMTRYSIAGGMPRYLEALGSGDLEEILARVVVGPYSPLFNEPRTLLSTELREPAVYFSVLAELATKPQDVATIANALRMEAKELSGYLRTLESLRLVARRRPVGATTKSRNSQWKCTDHFIRFWFRFVQPFQAELEAGGSPRAHVEHNVMPYLADHAAPVFEDAVTSWVRQRHAGATEVGAWWGPSLNRLRASKERSTEEVDTVALRGRSVVALAEAKWRNKPLDAVVLQELLDYKLPALGQAGFSLSDCEIVLASRGGFTAGLRALADRTPRTRLVHATELLEDLIIGDT